MSVPRTRFAPLGAVWAAAATFALGAAVPLAAQCTDPPAPPRGFSLTQVLDQPVTYGDGAMTRIDVRYPSAPPGSCGWPVVIVVHGLGNTKSDPPIPVLAGFLSGQGYLTAAYDVRGQGAAGANPASMGCTLVGEAERLDLAEIVTYLATTYPGVADTSRLAITGYSQGAAHSWAAAACSGRTLPPNNRGITTFPVFKAAYPISLSPIDAEFLMPEGKAFTFQDVVAARSNIPGLVWEPTFLSAIRNAIAAEDFNALAAIWANDPWRQDLANLATSTVPVLLHVQWNDVFAPVDLAVRALDAMPSTTPTRAILSTIFIHGNPLNFGQRDLSFDAALRWFDRFLKGAANQVDTEPRFVSGVVSGSEVEYRNAATLIWNRYSDTWPPSGTVVRSYYLRQGGVLDSSAPATTESADTVQHIVPAGASMTALLAAADPTAQVAAWFPENSAVYDTAALQSDVEIVGSPRAEIEVTPNGPDYQLHCALYQVHPDGTERYLQTGMALVRGDGSTKRLAVDFHDIRALLPAGERLRLKVQDVTKLLLPVAPGAVSYQVAPYFQSVAVDIEHSASRVSRLDIPVAGEILPALSSHTVSYDTLGGSDIDFQLESTPALAGAPYVVLFGESGMTPGFALPGGGTALLNVDAVTTGFLSALNGPFTPGTLGVLDAGGSAVPSPRLVLSAFPPLTPLVGMRFNALGVVLTSNGRDVATNPLGWAFR